MLIKTLEVGNLGANCCIVTDENTLECAVIDPGDESNVILDYIESNKLNVRAILLTHGHFDHTGAVEAVREETGAPVYINSRDLSDKRPRDMMRFSPKGETVDLAEGDEIKVGGLTFKVMETPGHSPGSVTFICEDVLFTGDTLFFGGCGRTDLPGGDMRKLMQSLKRLAGLPGDYEIYPGHMGTTSLRFERASNYYMRYARGEETE